MDRNIQKNGLINLFLMLVMGVAGFSTARYADSLAGQVAMSFAALGLLVAFVSWFQMRLEETERLEKLEYEELSKSKGGSTLFESKGAEVFPAQHSREQFERYFVPVFTVLLLIGQGAGAYFLWRWVAKAGETATLKQPMVAMALFGLFALILFMIGKFSATLARLEQHRLLRPGAGYVLLNAYLCFVVALGIVGVEAGFARVDVYVAKGLCVLLGLVAIENL
ncbi:MAG TPA: hypothetical protein VKA67_10165, partial [Verrucomicrobiae bacterium]|nr:hypothetical protein [Verrucomicrobiae bacterium]